MAMPTEKGFYWFSLCGSREWTVAEVTDYGNRPAFFVIGGEEVGKEELWPAIIWGPKIEMPVETLKALEAKNHA